MERSASSKGRHGPPQITVDEAIAWMKAHPYGEQDENGVDLSLIRESLRLTPTERARRLSEAVRAIRRIRPDVER
jgi:hypothetical protein